MIRILGLLLFALLMLLSDWFRNQGFCQGVGVPGSAPTVYNSRFFLNSSCNQSNCHGNAQATAPISNRAGAIWNFKDPHAHAFAVLENQRSREIVMAFASEKEIASITNQPEGYGEFLERNCVACHASEVSPRSERLLGVDCQSCHGNANAWGDTHYMKPKPANNPAVNGRVDLESLWSLAETCGSCHIGQLQRSTTEISYEDGSRYQLQDREVNHRLMAAGHPPTYFELGNYLERYPKHWKPKADCDREGGLDTWRIGKIVAASQRLQLLRNRLAGIEWPEFTEFRCTSCHNPLPTSTVPLLPVRKSVAEWDAWYLDYVDLALDMTDEKPSVSEWRSLVSELRNQMEDAGVLHRSTGKSEVMKTVDQLLQILQSVIESKRPIRISTGATGLPASEVDLLDLQKQFLAMKPSASWESAAQWTLAIDAIINARACINSEAKLDRETIKGYLQRFSSEQWKVGQKYPYMESEAFNSEQFLLDVEQVQKLLQQSPNK